MTGEVHVAVWINRPEEKAEKGIYVRHMSDIVYPFLGFHLRQAGPASWSFAPQNSRWTTEFLRKEFHGTDLASSD